MEILPARKFDLQYIADLYNDPANNRYLLRGHVTVEDLKKVKGRKDFVIFEDGGNIAGWFGLFPKGEKRARFAIIIDHPYQGQGLGSFALKSLQVLAKNSGFEILEFDVHGDNAAAIHIYEKAGFQKQYAQVRYEKKL